MVQMGDVCSGMDRNDAALVAYRVGAVKFAQRGLFAQSLLCCERMLRIRPYEAVSAEIAQLPGIAGRSNVEIAGMLFRTTGQFEDLVAELLSGTSPSHGMVGEGTPLLRSLRGETFAELAASAPLRRFAPDSTVLEQGASGRNMFLIAKGRVMVFATTTDGVRIYLSSLTAGDFFGENGFFTGAPRSATVEALYPVEAFEIDDTLWERLTRDVPEARDVLLRFYKERIVDVVLAKSGIFGLLPNDARRAVLDKFDLQTFEAGARVINEGEASDQIYVIKNGEAEVFTDRDGTREVLSVLGPGRLFGEVAALRHIPRTASVTAKTPLETLRLAAADFNALLDAKPDVRQRVNDEVAVRALANIDRLASFKPPA
jgi:CRP-like cAMP-binding protein